MLATLPYIIVLVLFDSHAANLSGSVITLSLTGPEKEVLVVLSFTDNDMVVAVSVVIPTSTGVIAEPLWQSCEVAITLNHFYECSTKILQDYVV
jgi:hypothetical protein